VGITFVVTSWVFGTVRHIIKIFDGQVRDTPSFIIRMLVDGRPESEFEIITFVINDFFDGIEVIFPSRSTFVSDIGFSPLGSLFVEDFSV